MTKAAWPERLWVVRHAESVGNAARIAAQEQGAHDIGVKSRDPDIPLSPRGVAQAEALGRWSAGVGAIQPTTILVSPYQRTRETAATIAQAAGWPLFGAVETGAPVAGEERPTSVRGDQDAIPIVTDERLREKDAGRLEGLTREGIIARYPTEAEAYQLLGKFYYRPPGGESWCDVILRLRALVDLLRTEYVDQRVLVVTHQVVVVCLRYVLEGLDEERVLALEKPGEVANASVTTYERKDGQLQLAAFNSVAHLVNEPVAVTAEPPAHTAPAVTSTRNAIRRDAPESATLADVLPEASSDDPGPVLINSGLLKSWPLPQPTADADKETRGRLLIVGGDARVPGGVSLAAQAALRIGVGKVQLGVAAPVAPALGVATPEALVIALPALANGAPDPGQVDRLKPYCCEAAVTIVGPGLVEPDEAAALVCRIADWLPEQQLILDAAALAGLTEALGERLAGRLLITPNALEAAQILDWEQERITAEPATAAQKIARRFQAVVVLKGRETQIVGPKGEQYLNTTGNVGLAVSGSGDVLVGIIGGLLARGLPLLQAACWGVFLHGTAADALATTIGPLGYLPREISEQLPGLLLKLAAKEGE